MKDDFNNAIAWGAETEDSENNNQSLQNDLVPYQPEVLQPEQFALAQQQAQVASNQASTNYIPNYQQDVPYYLCNIASADITRKQAQILNFKCYEAWIDLNAYHAKKAIDLEFEVRRQMMMTQSYIFSTTAHNESKRNSYVSTYDA